MKFFAVVSDIHANLPALQSVIADAEKVAGKLSLSFICLGDVVDYGPHPNQCMNRIENDKRFILKICGNHDQEMESNLETSPKIGQDHWAFTLWTRKTLFSKYRPAISKWCSRNFVKGHGIHELRQFVFIHGGLDRSLNDLADTDIPNLKQIREIDEARRQFEFLKNHNALFGHTHYQGYFIHHDYDDIPEMRLAVPSGYGSINRNKTPQLFEVPLGKDPLWEDIPDRVLLNPGSVGQPRWHTLVTSSHPNPEYRADPVTCYMLLKVDRKNIQFAFRQCQYEHPVTIRALQKINWPKNSTKDEIRNVAGLLEKINYSGVEHSFYRQPIEKSAPSHSAPLTRINQRLDFEIKHLIQAIDSKWQE